MRSNRSSIPAFVCFAAAQTIPAFRLAGDTMFGFMASYLQFFAVLSSGLEPGQRPAAALGIIANLGFLATFSALWLGSRRWAKRIAIVAAVSAFGSVFFLATGAESFAPYPGCMLWLATGVLLVRASSAPGPIPSDHTMNPTSKGARALGIALLGGMFMLMLIFAWYGARLVHQSQLRSIDERIIAEVEARLIADLHALADESEISQRYGKFKELRGVRWWDRPTFMLQTPRELALHATAHFENANAPIDLSITKGSLLATSLEMSPSEQWRREHPERGGELVVIDGEFWEVNGDLSSRCGIYGRASHPEFLFE